MEVSINYGEKCKAVIFRGDVKSGRLRVVNIIPPIWADVFDRQHRKNNGKETRARQNLNDECPNSRRGGRKCGKKRETTGWAIFQNDTNMDRARP